MKKRRAALMRGILGGICISAFSLLWAQSLAEDTQSLDEIVQICRNCIRTWTWNGYLTLTFTLAVFILGAVLALLRQLKIKNVARAAIIVGGGISLLTGINNLAFRKDHKTYLQWAGQGQKILADIQGDIALGYQPQGNFEARKEWIGRIKAKVDLLQDIPLKTAWLREDETRFRFTPVVYAGSADAQDPFWLEKPPIDDQYFYFVGVSESPDLATAKDSSLAGAVAKAADFFRSQIEVCWAAESKDIRDVGKIARYITDSYQVGGQFYRYDQVNKYYRYYTLIKLSRQKIEMSIKFYSVEESAVIPRVTYNIMNSTPKILSDDYQRSLAAQDQFLDSARATADVDVYHDLMTGRGLRERGELANAAARLEKAIADFPDSYSGWYELALTYQEMNELAKADKAFTRAADLESSLQKRDPSFYLTYGSFLLGQNRKQDAISQIEKALQIEPNYLRAQSVLKLLLEKR